MKKFTVVYLANEGDIETFGPFPTFNAAFGWAKADAEHLQQIADNNGVYKDLISTDDRTLTLVDLGTWVITELQPIMKRN